MLSEQPGRRRCKMTAKEFRRLKRKTGGLFSEAELREEELLRRRPELYTMLARMTIQELEEYCLKNN